MSLFSSIILYATLFACANAFEEKIVGGELVSIEDFPYQVSVQYLDEHVCGGSIIGPKHILTASHCTNGYTQWAFTVRVGSVERNNGGEVYEVAEIHQHPNFEAATYDFDVAVIILKTKITLGRTAAIIKLTLDEIPAGNMAVVSGWGYTKEGGSFSDKLKAVELPLVSRSACQSAYKNDNITERMICGGYLGIGGEDACQGDSGGPLVHDGVQIGVVSWGEGCARPTNPGVFANVENLRSFIAGILG